MRDLAQLDSVALGAFVAAREAMLPKGESLTPRYAWRLMSLVRRVQTWSATAPRGGTAADQLLAARPEVRLANLPRHNETIEHLSAPEVRRLLRSIGCQHQLARADRLARWQDLRNVTAAALQLGAGLGPGDIRALTCRDVDAALSLRHAAAGAHLAWPDQPPDGELIRPPRSPCAQRLWVRVPANGNAPTHEAPLAAWAARVLAAWLRLRAQLGIPGDWLLPSTRTGKPWGKVAQYEAGCAVLADADIPSRAAGGSFRLRHSFALRQLALGHAPDTVASWLGVSDPAVMQRYLRTQQRAHDAPE
ncbi:integrase [Aquabacterium sp. OR-4]|uniref:integrase n=1 Tax=Aquabacterium sp. OR-4 TaxID=2978127 RepID=UPI0028CADB18|nr:integrase [Aquabacterium sp. OR-4]MDT7838511.1 integrase [Aquabacterium sp. OR-4]